VIRKEVTEPGATVATLLAQNTYDEPAATGQSHNAGMLTKAENDNATVTYTRFYNGAGDKGITSTTIDGVTSTTTVEHGPTGKTTAIAYAPANIVVGKRKIHRPDVIGMGRLRPVGSQLRLDPTLGNLVAELQVHLLVKTIDSLRIDGPPVALEQDMNATITVTHPCLADVFDLQLQLGLLAARGLVDIKRPVNLQHRTCAPDLDRVDKLALAGRLQSFFDSTS